MAARVEGVGTVQIGKQAVESAGRVVVFVELVAGAHEDAACAVFEELQDIAVVRKHGQPPEIVLVGIEARPVDGGDPQPLFRIQHQILNLVVGQAQRIVRTEILLVFVRIVLVEPAERSEPDMPLGIFRDGFDLLVGDVVRDQRTLRSGAALGMLIGAPARHGHRDRQAEAKKGCELHGVPNGGFSEQKVTHNNPLIIRCDTLSW